MTTTTLTASILPEDIELEVERLEGLKLDPPLTARQKIRDMVDIIMSDSSGHPFASHQILHHINEYLYLSKTYGNGEDEDEHDTLLLAAHRAGLYTDESTAKQIFRHALEFIGQVGFVHSQKKLLSLRVDTELKRSFEFEGRSRLKLLADFNLHETEMVVQAADWTLAADVINKEQYANLIRMIFVERLDLDPSAFNHTIYDFNGEEEYQLKHEVLEDKLGAVYEKVRRSHNFDVSETRELALALSKARSRNRNGAEVTLALANKAEKAADDELNDEESTSLDIDHCKNGGNLDEDVMKPTSIYSGECKHVNEGTNDQANQEQEGGGEGAAGLFTLKIIGWILSFLGVIFFSFSGICVNPSSDGTSPPKTMNTKATKKRKWNYHCSRFLCLCTTLILVSSPTCTRAEGGGDVSPPFASISDDLKTLTELSRNSHLRGSDPAATMTDVKNIVQRHLQSIEAMQKMYQNGDNNGLISVVETLLSDKETLQLAISQMKEISGEDPFNGEDVPLDSIVEEMKVRGEDDKFQLNLIEAFQDSDFNSLVDEMKHISGILSDMNIEDLSLLSPYHNNHRRMAKNNLFDQSGSDNRGRHTNIGFDEPIFPKKQKSQFAPNTFSYYAKRMENTGKFYTGRGRVSHHSLPHIHHALHGDPVARRLRVNDRNSRRRLAAEQCLPPCPFDDVACTCGRLYGCLNEMSTYDMAVLTLGGYIVSDGNDMGNLTTDTVNVYDLGDGGLLNRYSVLKTRASLADPQDLYQCTKVLEEVHSSCPATTDGAQSCSSTNNQAYQLSVNEVCDAVHTNVKLNLLSMFDIFSNKPNCLRITTDTKRYSNGYLIVYVDYGNGYEKIADSSFHFGEIVVDDCYPALVGVKVTQGSDTGAWIGTIELSNDGGKSYNHMKCSEGCTCGENGCFPTMPVCVDGNSDAVGVADVYCLGSSSKNCTFAPEWRDPEKRECIRITADTCDKWCDGMPLQVSIDQGNGYQVIADSTYAIGEVVVEQCYPAVIGVRVMNPNNKAFIGNFEYSNDSGVTYKPMMCKDCNKCNSSCNKNPMVVDGNADAVNVGETYCHNAKQGKPCYLVPDVDEVGAGFFATGGSHCVRWTTGNNSGDNGHFRFRFSSEGTWKYFSNGASDYHYYRGDKAGRCTTDVIKAAEIIPKGPWTGAGKMEISDHGATTETTERVYYPLICKGCGCKSSPSSGTVDYTNNECKKDQLAPIELGVTSDSFITGAEISCKKSAGCGFERLVFAVEEKGQYCKSPSFTVCAEFVQLFSELYGYRDEEKYPRGNPLAPPGLATGTNLVSDTCYKTWYNEVLKGLCISDDDSGNSYSVRCCGGSRETNDLQCSPGNCEYAATFEEANSICANKGMRLCTKEDILFKKPNGRWLCCDTGCNFDQTLSWTGETCENLFENIDDTKLLLSLAIFYKEFDFDQSKHGVNTIETKIGNPYKVYNGCDSSFSGKCVDGYGNHYGYVRSKNDVPDLMECKSFCDELPFTENQVGLQTATNKKCYCLYKNSDVPLPKDIASGITYEFKNWNEETDGNGPVSRGDGNSDFQCHLSAAQVYKSSRETVSTCDTTMSMFLGEFTSVGRLAGIVEEVRNKGTYYMPGRCCLDKPTTATEHFGHRYDPSRLTCTNEGDFYLRISREACENVGGIWTRSPCLTLKDCIDNRPAEGSEGFSQSFEDFAANLVISDPEDEDQCGASRQGLGFDADFAYDTEVCDEFNRYSCDSFFDGVDDDRGGEDASFENISYEPPNYAPDPALVITPLPDSPTLTKVDTEADGEKKTAKDRLELSKVYLGYSLTMARIMKSMQIDINKGICNQGPWFVQVGCWIVFIILYPLTIVGILALVVAVESVAIAHAVVKNGLVNYAKMNYMNGLKEGKWAYDSMNIINQNLHDVNTQLMGILQDRHTKMEININTYTMCSTNYLGEQLILAIDPEADVDTLSVECQDLLGVSRRRLEEGGTNNQNELDGPKNMYKLGVTWGNETENGMLSDMSDLVGKAKNISVWIRDTVFRIEDSVERIEAKLEDQFPSKVGKADKEPDSNSNRKERNRMLKMEHLDNAVQTLNEKIVWMETYVKDMDKRVNDKLDKLIGVVSTLLESEAGEEEETIS